MLDEWNEKVNKHFCLATEQEVFIIATKIVNLITTKESK